MNQTQDDDREGDNESSHVESPSPSLEIKGIVKEEEDMQLESQGGGKMKASKIQVNIEMNILQIINID